MKILVVGEDSLCCALGERVVAACLPGWALAGPSIDCKGVTGLAKALPRFQTQAMNVQPVLCIADVDRRCAVEMLADWLPQGSHPHFVLRLAVTESESWVLADRGEFAESFAVPVKRVCPNPDDELDPKTLVLNLARRSRIRTIREEVVSPFDSSKPGAGYNLHLCSFVRARWDAQRASENSPSLCRAMKRVTELGQWFG